MVEAAMVQAREGTSQIHRKGKNNAVSAGLNIPLGNFSATHCIGIDYSLTKHRYRHLNSIAGTYFAFMVNVGADFYIGK